MAQCFGLEPSPLLGLAQFMNNFFCAFLFCGMFVAPNYVIWPFRLFTYIMPLQWTMKAFVYAVFIDTPEYKGAMPCTPGTMIPIGNASTTSNFAWCASYKGRSTGFYCPEDPAGYLCFGQSGEDIIDSLGVRFTIFDSDTSYGHCILYILSFGVFFRLVYLFRIVTQCSRAAVPEAPDSGVGKKVAPTPAQEEPTPKPPNSPPSGSKSPKVAAAAATSAAAPTSSVNATCVGITYVIPPKGMRAKSAPKTIISDIGASVSAGEVLAIIGPSGSGKTTLLNSLTLEPGPGVAYGKMAINGHPVTPSVYIKYCAYVPREDNLWTTITARAHIVLAVACYHPHLDAVAREQKVDELLKATGMESCQHTRAGDIFRPGLSGGQRRRLSLALALVKEPKLIILDEPTSGLDSAAAAAITKLLGDMAARTSAAIVCTIHQPSAAVLAGFQKVFVLSEGRTAYFGPTAQLTPHMEKLGFKLPQSCNPAEFVLDLVSKDISPRETVDKMLAAGQPATTIPPQTALAPPVAATGLAVQTWVLTRRTLSQAFSDPTVYLVRMVMNACMISFFGVIYIESAQEVNPQAQFRLFFLWWVLCVPISLDLITVFLLNLELKTVKTEVKNGMYSPIAYVLSNTIVQLPFMFALTLCAILPAFAIGGWSFDNFFTFLISYACMAWAWECLAQLMSLMSNPVLGMLNFVSAWSAGILFCGLVFRAEDCIWPLRALVYILPLSWQFNSAAYDVFMPARYSDAELCTPGSTPQCTSFGYVCPNLTSLYCFGHTGAQVLETLHLSYDTLDSKDTRAFNVSMILVFAVFLKLCYGLGVWRATRATASLRSPPMAAL